MNRSPPAARRRGVVAVVMRGSRLLVIRRSRHVVAPRAFCFPGGAIQEGESEPQAVVREFEEELATSVSPIQSLWQSTTDWNVDLAWWNVELDALAEPVAQPEEVESVHWMTVDEMRRLEGELLRSNHDFLDAWQRGEFTIR